MPASAFGGEGDELSRHNSLEDQRALQVALELSLLNLGEHHHHQHAASSAVSPDSQYSQQQLMDHTSFQYAEEMRFLAKKSQNMTECVPVPSSEHVAEIVGRQGCKIKALRAKTNTYIKTPVRGEEPVFVVTGRKEDLVAAKREILSAAEHFSQIRASRRNGVVGQGLAGSTGLVPPPPVPGQVTIQVRVPYRVVGLVVGPKGATIKRIQQQTSTYIVTPSREKEPIFEVTGMPENVEQAKREIEAHIALRTGLMSSEGSSQEQQQQQQHSGLQGLNCLGLGMLGSTMENAVIGQDLMLNCLYGKAPTALRSAVASSASSSHDHHHHHRHSLSMLAGLQDATAFSSASLSDGYGFSSASDKLDGAELQTLGSGLLNSLYDSDEGIGLGGSDSPTLGQSLIQPNIWSTDYGLSSSSSSLASNAARRSNSFGFPASSSSVMGSTSSSIAGGALEQHRPARRISSDPLAAVGSALNCLSAAFQMNGDADSGVRGSSASGSASPAASPVGSGSSNSSTRGSLKRECILCCEGEMVAALVPCGHKLFCMDCAQRLVHANDPDAADATAAAANNNDADAAEESASAAAAAAPSAASGKCPVCHEAVTQAIRIFS